MQRLPLALFACALVGCTPSSATKPRPTGKGGDISASVSNNADSNVDTNVYRGVSNGGAESVGGEWLEMDTVNQITDDLSQGLDLRINEASSFQHWWTPAVGTIALGPDSPATVHYLEQLVTDTGVIFRDWQAIDGALEIEKLSKESISFRIRAATMKPETVSSKGRFTLDALAEDLVF